MFLQVFLINMLTYFWNTVALQTKKYVTVKRKFSSLLIVPLYFLVAYHVQLLLKAAYTEEGEEVLKILKIAFVLVCMYIFLSLHSTLSNFGEYFTMDSFHYPKIFFTSGDFFLTLLSYRYNGFLILTICDSALSWQDQKFQMLNFTENVWRWKAPIGWHQWWASYF